jgi:hypothetical protein
VQVIIETTTDGSQWRAVHFRFKPGDVSTAPRWAAPHQPRLDWQMCVLLGDAKSSLSDTESSLSDAKSSLSDARSSLSDAEGSLGDAKSSLGDAKSSLGDAKSSQGDAG